MAQNAQSDLGNTKPNRVRLRSICITLNNYLDKEYEELKGMAQKLCSNWILGKEVGKEGTKHIQGFMRFSNPTDIDMIKKNINNRMHIEKAKGSLEQNFKYCSKDGVYEEENMVKITKQDIIKRELIEKYKNVVWKDWQKNILNIINEEPDERSIVWIYDKIGNNGKTFLRKYIALIRECIICDGKKDNVLNSLKIKCIDEDKDVEIIILDIPRHNENFVNYGLIEQLKDGHVYSGKYEGGEIWLRNVHVIIFSNNMPDKSKFSNDRWNIININS